jgi:uncharacterized membrane protein YeaQ/YmgE (transglycosylase-associated protein family)
MDQAYGKETFMYDPGNFFKLIWILIFGGAAGWVVNSWGKGSGLGLFWDIAGGILGGLLGASFAYCYNVNADGFGAVIGVGFLGSVLFLTLLWLLSLYRRTAKRNRKI